MGADQSRHRAGSRRRAEQSPFSLVVRALVAFLAAGLLPPLAAFGQAPKAESSTQAMSPRQAGSDPNDYVIGAQDVLVITMWDQADMSGKFTVEADGSFTYPLIGRIKAGGLSLRQFESELKKRLAAGYFKNPQVSVAVEQYRSQRVFVVGEVRTPGAYTLTGDMTLIEALARAGSATADAGTEAVIVRPTGKTGKTGPVLPGEPTVTAEIIRVDIKELQSGALQHNLGLRDGDTIFVPRAETIYVFGQVRSPGAYALQSRDTTVLQALALAGGVTDRGSTSRIKILRIVDGKKAELKAKLSDIVMPGDTIVVPERYF